jgi:hypothetical protein
MRSISDSVCNEISHAWVDVLHIHFHSQAALSLFVSTLSHMLKELQILLDTSVSIWGVNFFISSLTHFFS